MNLRQSKIAPQLSAVRTTNGAIRVPPMPGQNPHRLVERCRRIGAEVAPVRMRGQRRRPRKESEEQHGKEESANDQGKRNSARGW